MTPVLNTNQGPPMGAQKGGGPMPMPNPGGPQGGGPQPMPKPPGGGAPGGDRPWQQSMGDAGDRMAVQRSANQSAVDEANMALRRAQLSGANPMQLAELEQAAMQAQRGMEQWQGQQFADQMSQNWQQGQRYAGSLGGGQSQQPQNPYAMMMLQNQLGMGGGRGDPSQGLGGIGRG